MYALLGKFIARVCHFRVSLIDVKGCVNKQNSRLWSEEQPEALQKLPIHPEKGLWTGGIIGPY